MVLAKKEFDLIFDTDPTKNWFVAQYYNLDGLPVNILDLVSKVTTESILGDIPAELTFTVKDALFAWNDSGGTSGFLFAIDWGMGVSLSNLPLVGKYFGPDETLDLAFQVLFASNAGFNTSVISDLNTLIPPGSGWELNEAEGINSAGEIVGLGIHNGLQRAYLLTPQ